MNSSGSWDGILSEKNLHTTSNIFREVRRNREDRGMEFEGAVAGTAEGTSVGEASVGPTLVGRRLGGGCGSMSRYRTGGRQLGLRVLRSASEVSSSTVP